MGAHETSRAKRDLELVYMPVARQRSLFRSRKLSPIEVLEAQITQIERFGARINPITFTHFDEARKAARRSEACYRKGEDLPLDGISVAIKDQFEKKGWKVTAGSQGLGRHPAETSHPFISKLVAAGAVLHIQTTVPEFYLVPLTWSRRWGVTRNPWNLAMTPGGSSGGSAAAVAAGMATVAIGSDMGGSIRIPASLTGLYGFHPPYGRNPGTVSEALLVHSSSGPIARSLDDLILLQNVLTGPHEAGPAVRPVLSLARRHSGIKGWKIAVSMNQGWARVDSDVEANTHAAVAWLKKAGAGVDYVDLELGLKARSIRQGIEKALFSTAIGGELITRAQGRKNLTTYARRFLSLAKNMKPIHAHEASGLAAQIQESLERTVFNKGYRVLICPTTTTTNIPAQYDPTADRLKVKGTTVDPYVGWHLASIFNLLNWMPVITVPTGQGRNKVPTGIQIAASAYDDWAAIAVASAFSKQALRLFEKDRVPASIVGWEGR